MTETPAPTKSSRGMRDLVMSLIVLLIPVAVIVTIFRLGGGEDPVVIDPSPAIEDAQRASFPVAVPTGLAEGWRPLSAAFQPADDGATLRIGYLTPSGGGVQLVESTQPADVVLARELGEGVRPAGAVTVAGRPWDSYTVRSDERALIAVEQDRLLIVVGRAAEGELEELAQAVS